MVDAIGAFLILAGASLAALAGFGQLRFKDLFVRMHVATKPPTLGLLMVAIGTMLRIDGQGAIAALLLIVALQFLTAPVSAHLVGRAAHRKGEWERDDVVIDDLAEVDEL
ncbi:MAG TPA: monovalent cation/H(+) antiporter subunit G [Microthrixaceae bacterium]|jgi:multicomponent Na+:H+ antiporter subunit G|nr:monovalent cation/H(+) antiporter subunit G [Microthrixaceae bacterium]